MSIFNKKAAIDCHKTPQSGGMFFILVLILGFCFYSKATNKPHSEEVIAKYEEQKIENMKNRTSVGLSPDSTVIISIIVVGGLLMSVFKK